MSSADGEVDISDGEVSASGDWPTASVEQNMLSMWPGVRPCSLCSWTPLVLLPFLNRRG